MADNIDITPGSGKTVATDDVSDVHHQLIKVEFGAGGSATMVSSTDPLPVELPVGDTATGTIDADDETVTLTVPSGAATAGIQITGTFSGSLTPQATIDGSTWVAIYFYGRNGAGGTVPGGFYGSADAAGIFTIPVAGFAQVRLIGSSWVSGAAVVTILPSLAPAIVLPGSLPPGNQTIGYVGVTTISTSVTPGNGSAHLGKAEDAPHGSGDTGVAALAVRRNTAAVGSGADGDYSTLNVNGSGYLYVTPEGLVAEDAAHTTGDKGMMPLAVRNDGGSALAGTDGDYIPLSTDSSGNLRTTAAVTSLVPGTGATNLGKAEDAAHNSGDTGVMALAVRSDTPSAKGADGDYVPILTDVNGAVYSRLMTVSATSLDRQDDAAFTPGSHYVMPTGMLADETSTDSVDEGDAGIPRMTLDRKVIVAPQPHAKGGLSVFRSLDLDESEEEVSSGPCTVYGWWITNFATSTRYVKFYNATAASTTVGTTTPVITLAIPGNSSDDIAANALGGVGISFDTALCVAATTALADNDTGAPSANDVLINLFYKA